MEIKNGTRLCSFFCCCFLFSVVRATLNQLKQQANTDIAAKLTATDQLMKEQIANLVSNNVSALGIRMHCVPLVFDVSYDKDTCSKQNRRFSGLCPVLTIPLEHP